MKISNVSVKNISIPLKHPFKTALRTVNSVEDILVRIDTDDGLTGWGEAAPTAVITGDITQSLIGAITDYIAPAIIGRDLSQFDAIMAALHACILKNSSAKAAVDIALFDLFAQSAHLPLYKLLGGAKPQIQTDLTISLNAPEQMVTDSLAAVAEGFHILKVKVGKGGAADARTIAQIRKAVGPGIELRVDANQGWTPKEAVRNIRAMEDSGCDIALVEQPVAAHDIDGLRFVTQNALSPILADEAVFSLADAVTIITAHAADLINIKLMKTGGIYEALKICALAESYGVRCMMGCMMESKVSVAAAAHVAAAKHIVTMADLDGPSLCASDPYEGGPIFEGASITMTDDPGLGVKPKNSQLIEEVSN
jgi:o-succinylbenzoate synthase